MTGCLWSTIGPSRKKQQKIMAMFEELGSLLSQGSALSKLTSLGGGDSTSTQKALGGAVPLLLGALGKSSSTAGGASALFNLIKGDNGGALENLGGLIDHGDAGGIGNTLLGGLLGKRRGAVEAGLAQHAGLPVGGISKLLPILMPIVMGFLSKQRVKNNLDEAGVGRLLSDERGHMEKAGLGGMLGLLDGGDDNDHKGFLDSITKIAGLGGLAAMVPGLGKIVGSVTDKLGGATASLGSVGSTVGASVGSVTNTVKTGAANVTAQASRATNVTRNIGSAATSTTKNIVVETSKKRPAWMWLLPLLLIGGLGALGLSKCKKDDKPVASDSVAVESVAAESVAAESVAAETVATETVATETVPAAVVETTVAAAPTGTGTDIVATALGDPRLSILTKAIGAAGLSDTLKGAGPFTVFAPTDDAFNALPKGVLNSLLKPQNKDLLTKVLSYHVVGSAVKAGDVVTGDVASVEGTALKLVSNAGVVTVNDAAVLTGDVVASNGVVHIIDHVLVPSSIQLSQLVNSAGDSTSEDLTVYFASGSAVIDAEGQAKIAKAVAILSSVGTGPVAMVGHADTNGNPAKNQALSTERAKNVSAAITAGLGADASKFTMTTDAKGDADPVENLAKSRRVTIEIG
jgi:uncharacterized surface protein with fasciclin (FAS1) repeats